MGISLHAEDAAMMELSTSPLQAVTAAPAVLNNATANSAVVNSGSNDGSSVESSAAVISNTSAAAATNNRLRRRRKKRSNTLVATTFTDLYTFTGEVLGEGSYGKVVTCKNVYTNLEYACKIIEKNRPGLYNRSKVLKEIDIYHLCRDHPNILHMIEYFEEDDCFYLIFEKMNGGPLLHHIQARIFFTEAEAAAVIKNLAEALRHLHKQGVAHRDLKPDNILCVNYDNPCPVKLCDFDLCSKTSIDISTPKLLTPVGSVEYMAPEVVDLFITNDYIYDDDEEDLCYDKKCDLWSLGVIAYILMCGYVPFSGRCGEDCGWDQGDNCENCQIYLFESIKEGRVEFHDKYWSNVSAGAKDLIRRLLVTDASQRLDANGVLEHPWIVSGGCQTTTLATPTKLQQQTSIKDLEDLASRAMAVNRAFAESTESLSSSAAITASTQSASIGIPSSSATSQRRGDLLNQQLNHLLAAATDVNNIGGSGGGIPWQRETLSLSPLEESHCSLLERRRRSKLFHQTAAANRFASIDEIVLQDSADTLMKAI